MEQSESPAISSLPAFGSRWRYLSLARARLLPEPLLFLPLALFTSLALLYLLAVPVGESPDEPGHLRCIEQVAIGRHLPTIIQAPSTTDWWLRENIVSDYMCYHMPAYYVVAGYLLRGATAVTGGSLHYEFPPGNSQFGVEAAMFAHQPRPSALSVAQPLNLILLRLFSILCGLVVLASTYVVARHMFPEHRLVPLAAVTLLAGWPQFIFIHRAISNDPMATALAAAVLAVLVFVGRPHRFIVAGLLAAVALLTKLTVAFTIPAVLAAWCLEFWFYRRFDRRKRRAYLQVLPVCLVTWAAVILLIWFQPTLRANWQFAVTDFAGVPPVVRLAAYWQQIYVWTLSSGWAWFGWLNVPAPAGHAQLWWFSLQVMVLLGVYVALKRPSSTPYRLLLLILAVWWTAVFLSYLRVTINRWQPQFRFAFAVLPLLTSLMAGGVFPWLKSSRAQWLLWLLLMATLFSYNLWLLFGLIIPTYN
jgi:hypothetical protein